MTGAYAGESRLWRHEPDRVPARRHIGALRYQVRKRNLVAGTDHKQQVADLVAREYESRQRTNSGPKNPAKARLKNRLTRSLEGGLQLHVSGRCLGEHAGQSQHYDWDTGKVFSRKFRWPAAGGFIASQRRILIVGSGRKTARFARHAHQSGDRRAHVEEENQPTRANAIAQIYPVLPGSTGNSTEHRDFP